MIAFLLYCLLFLLFVLLAALLGHFAYTKYRLRHSRLLPGALPLFGHLHLLLSTIKSNDNDIMLGLRALVDVPGGVCTMLMGVQPVTLVKKPEVVRAVLSSSVFNDRPRTPKWEVGSLVSEGPGPRCSSR